MRVLVCGGRDFADASLVWDVLDKLHEESRIDVIIEGGAGGADRLAFDWATNRSRLGDHVGTETHDADWEKYGRAAGPIRNQKMLQFGEPALVVAFPGGRGTADMMTQARRAGVRVIEVPARTSGGEP